jgi:hypothetical protein
MQAATRPILKPGRVYRTRELARLGANAPRTAKRLVREGHLLRLAHGLFASPTRSRFGVVPPDDKEVVRAFLDGAPFVFTGPERWNALGLGTTAVSTERLVYNTKRTGSFEFGGRRFRFRRVAFPRKPTPEWFIVDLLEHAEQAGASRDALASALERALRNNRFDPENLRKMAERYGTKETLALVNTAISGAAA